jgi:hypothetical protein
VSPNSLDIVFNIKFETTLSVGQPFVRKSGEYPESSLPTASQLGVLWPAGTDMQDFPHFGKRFHG